MKLDPVTLENAFVRSLLKRLAAIEPLGGQRGSKP
jgi:hypothetical protein